MLVVGKPLSNIVTSLIMLCWFDEEIVVSLVDK